jgi:hypothetical protein
MGADRPPRAGRRRFAAAGRVRACGAPLLATAIALALWPARGHAACEDVARALFGLGFGPVAGYVDALRPGLRREGTGRLVPEVGFESLSGTVDGVAWERVMAFDDHGRFYSLVGVGSVPGAADAGLEAITRQVTQASGLSPTIAGTRATYACAAPYELVVEARPGRQGARVAVSLADTARRLAAQRYVQDWCADPAHQDLPSACAR